MNRNGKSLSAGKRDAIIALYKTGDYSFQGIANVINCSVSKI